MKRKRFSEEQIISVVKEAEAGAKTADLARRHGVPEATNYNWKAKCGGLETINAYDEFGMPGSAGGAQNSGRFRYTGQIFIPEIGLYHYKARAYSPGIGRFMQTDPIGYGDGLNMYGYVGNDPVNYIDPTGMWEECGWRNVNPSPSPNEGGENEIVVEREWVCFENGLDINDFLGVSDFWRSGIGNRGDELQFTFAEGGGRLSSVLPVEPDQVRECTLRGESSPQTQQRTTLGAFLGGDPGHLHNRDEGGSPRESTPGSGDGQAAIGTGSAFVGTSTGLYNISVDFPFALPFRV